MNTITIHQPEHAPWLGLLDKIKKADTFVILDTVQFEKNYFQNRNQIGTEENKIWVTVPVKKHPLATAIKDIEIANGVGNVNWRDKYLTRIQQIYPGVTKTEEYKKIEEMIRWCHLKLETLNYHLMIFMFDLYGIKKDILSSSAMGLDSNLKGSDLILAICKEMKADRYIAGSGGRNYMRLDDFEKAGIEVVFNEPVYPHLSAYDDIFRNNHQGLK